MPQNTFFPQTHDLLVSPKNDTKTRFSILHPLSLVIFATATVVVFVLLCNSRFNFHCYKQRETTPTQKSAWKWHCNLSQLLARKITKGIHSCKPASLNCPIKEGSITDQVFLWSSGSCVCVKVYKGWIYNWPGPGFLEVVRFLCECEGV